MPSQKIKFKKLYKGGFLDSINATTTPTDAELRTFVDEMGKNVLELKKLEK